MKRPGLVATALVTGAVAAACTTPQDQDEPDRGPYWTFRLSLVDEDLEQEVADRLFWHAQEIVGACMVAQGFEYVPHDGSGMPGSYSESHTDGLEPQEYAEQFGYEIFIDGPSTATEITWEESTNPHAVYLRSLTAGELAAYNRALSGGSSDEELGGCEGELAAWREAFADARVLEAVRAWRTCMALAGYPGIPEGELSGQQVLYELYGQREAGSGRGATMSLEELQELERTVAIADVACRDESSFVEVNGEVIAEHEQAWIDANRAELETFFVEYSEALRTALAELP